MQMPAQAFVLPEIKKMLVQIPGLQRREAKSRSVRLIQYCPDKIPQSKFGIQVVSPRAKMDAGKDDLFGSFFFGLQFEIAMDHQSSADIPQDIFDRSAATRPARHGCYAEGAAVITAILNFDESSRP